MAEVHSDAHKDFQLGVSVVIMFVTNILSDMPLEHALVGADVTESPK